MTVNFGVDTIGKQKQNEIKSNRDFWIPKIERNICLDKAVNAVIGANGRKVLRFWGEEI